MDPLDSSMWYKPGLYRARRQFKRMKRRCEARGRHSRNVDR